MNPEILNTIEQLEKEVQLMKTLAQQGYLGSAINAYHSIMLRNQNLLSLLLKEAEKT